MPSVQSFYQILSQLTVILYLIMYLLMFSGAIALRYKMKKLNRPFRIGKSGNGLMWFVGGLGFCGSLLAFILSFIPPSQISTGSNTVWFSVLIIGAIIVVIAPFIIYASKKPSWVDPNSNFLPLSMSVQVTLMLPVLPQLLHIQEEQPGQVQLSLVQPFLMQQLLMRHPLVPPLPVLLHQAAVLLHPAEILLPAKHLREPETKIRMHLSRKD